MTEEDKKLIADYMGLVFNPARLSCYQYEDGREFKFNSNDASRCVKEMQKRGGWQDFVQTAAKIHKLGFHSEVVAWLFNAENFFNAMSEWLKERGK